jgi:hypothetical protein
MMKNLLDQSPGSGHCECAARCRSGATATPVSGTGVQTVDGGGETRRMEPEPVAVWRRSDGHEADAGGKTRQSGKSDLESDFRWGFIL